jgi:hypothetical protein
LLDDRLGKFLLLSLEGGAERRSAIPIRELAGKLARNVGSTTFAGVDNPADGFANTIFSPGLGDHRG